VAVTTAIAMVGALVLEPAISALTPSSTSGSTARTTAVALPAAPLVTGVEAAPSVEGQWGLARTTWRSSPVTRSMLVEQVSPLRPLTVLVPDYRSPPPELALASVMLSGRTTSAPAPPRAKVRSVRQATGDRSPMWIRVYRHRRWHVAPIVTWYGPGFYGNRTACGIRYTRYVIGLAHRTLPCGTLVRIRWHGLTATAPVIDRGPFNGAAYVFDLSAAMACKRLKPRGVHNSCFTRYDVKWRSVGKVKLKAWFAIRRRWRDR
jgi:hypothetical protein